MPILLACVAVSVPLTSNTAVADIMSSCETAIVERCSDVKRGRGRIVACLAANSDRLDGVCKSAVDVEMSKPMVRRSVPFGATPMASSSEGQELQASCRAELQNLCSGVRPEAESMLACLYARGDRVTKSCQQTADSVLKKLM